MEIDTIATQDAEAIRRLIEYGEPLSTSAAQFGYTPKEAQDLLNHTHRVRVAISSHNSFEIDQRIRKRLREMGHSNFSGER